MTHVNTTFSKPTAAALENAKRAYTSSFNQEIYMNGFEPTNCRDHFAVSVVNKRGSIQTIVDYTFTKKTGKLVSAVCVEKTYVD